MIVFATIDIPRKGFFDRSMAALKVPKTNLLPVRFIREVIAELKKVTWPTRQDTIKLTIMVIIVSIGIGVFVGGLDILFVNLSKTIFR